MKSPLVTLAAALTIGPAALIVGCGSDDKNTTDTATGSTTMTTTESSAEPTETPARSAGPESASCVGAWNDGSNSTGHQDLSAVFADGGFGNVIVGVEEGDCVLAAFNSNEPTYVVYQQAGDAFERAGSGPGDQFDEYRTSIEPVDVILQPSGQVEPVPR